jgi:hypothetical protein
MNAGEELLRFYERNHMHVGATDSPTLRIAVVGVYLPVPNPGYLTLHDVHHLVLDCPPTFWGEVQASAFELRSGKLRDYRGKLTFGLMLIYFLCVSACALGFLVGPRRTLEYFRRYKENDKRKVKNLYCGRAKKILAMDLKTLRAYCLEGAPVTIDSDPE